MNQTKDIYFRNHRLYDVDDECKMREQINKVFPIKLKFCIEF
jgi:hypothetical protein